MAAAGLQRSTAHLGRVLAHPLCRHPNRLVRSGPLLTRRVW
jgi:hypothetical protein